MKTGSDANAGTVVAVGSIAVRPGDDVLENVTIMLTDPVTGAPIILDDGYLSPQYFIGMYAENAAGDPAGMGRIQANLPNAIGNNHYLTTQNPTSAWMPASGANTVGFDHLLLTNPRVVENYRASEALKQDLGGGGAAIVEPVHWSPKKIYVAEGVEGSVYLGNLIADDAEDYAWSVSGTSHGRLQQERWTILPNGAVSAPAMRIRAHDKRTGEQLLECEFSLIGAAASAGNGMTRKVQLIGDSFAANGSITQTLLDNADADVMSVELIGTRGAGLNRHEGRGGWRIDDYATAGRTFYEFIVSGIIVEPQINSSRYTNNGAVFTVQEVHLEDGDGRIVCSATGGTPSASGVLVKDAGSGDATIAFSSSGPVAGNPFWKGGQLDYAQYLADNALDTPDVVFIELGVNDVFGQTADAGVKSLAGSRFALLDGLIASIKDAGVPAVALIPPAGPSGSQDAFAVSYGVSATRWRVKRNFILWNQELTVRYSGHESNGIYICPAGLNWDTENNANRASPAPVNSRSNVMVERQNNGVHPATSGYQQIGDAMWAFLKCTSP